MSRDMQLSAPGAGPSDARLFASKPPGATEGLAPADRARDVVQVVELLYQQSPDWATFFRVVFGLDGVIRQSFPLTADLEAFRSSEEHELLEEMLADLRRRTRAVPLDADPVTVITVRLPKSLHDTLKTEAHEYRTSLNRLCVSKLLQTLAVPEASKPEAAA